MSIDHYENFPVASVLLPPALRKPIALIYQFARSADDFADEGNRTNEERLALLKEFGDELRRIQSGDKAHTRLFQELAIQIAAHQLPTDLFHDLLAAFSQDVIKKRYENLDELLDYSRRSANPVGRLLLKLFDAASPQNLAWSDSICSSLQIINFLQDIAIDYAMGRIYMPREDLLRFGITEQQIAAGDTGGAWCDFMGFQVDRARRMLFAGAPLGRALRGRIGLEMRMIIAGGDRILTKILGVNCDIFRNRPVLRGHDWLLMLARTVSI